MIIDLKHGTPAEAETRAALSKLLEKYDLSGLIFTDRLVVDESAYPHSHPVLTLNTSHREDELWLLATFLHEQLHWYEEEHSDIRERAIKETSRCFPKVPSKRPAGAGDEYSTRLHLFVCYFELLALRKIVGNAEAERVIRALGGHHYSWIYERVLADEDTIVKIVRELNFVPDSLCEAVG